MQRSDPLWSEVNNLLGLLRDLQVVDLVRERYAKHNNDAPPRLLERRMEILQKALDDEK